MRFFAFFSLCSWLSLSQTPSPPTVPLFPCLVLCKVCILYFCHTKWKQSGLDSVLTIIIRERESNKYGINPRRWNKNIHFNSFKSTCVKYKHDYWIFISHSTPLRIWVQIHHQLTICFIHLYVMQLWKLYALLVNQNKISIWRKIC